MKHLIAILALCLALPAMAQQRMSAEEYIEKYKALAIADQREFGIPASVKMAQALLESDMGNSRLAVLGNNHFGIKCKSTWRGETITHDDDAKGECFRKYPTARDSWDDHARFLRESERYAPLFVLDPLDYKGWARTLKQCGYATNPRYPELLISSIERYKLYELDTETYGVVRDTDVQPNRAGEASGLVEDVEYQRWLRNRNAAGQAPSGTEVNTASSRANVPHLNDSLIYGEAGRMVAGHTVFHNNGAEFVFAAKGDTYESLASMTGISKNAIRRYNDAPGSQPQEGDMVYLGSKGRRAHSGHVLHTVREGETLHRISQIYGVRVAALANINRIRIIHQLKAGDQVRLM